MAFVFGPVPSRRLGLSLGVDIIPFKTCSLSCIYCQIGKTPQTTFRRKRYVTFEEISPELNEHLSKDTRPDWITISGSGEPTLNTELGKILTGIKMMTQIPVCVITNGALMGDPEVQKDLLPADVVMPSLDSARKVTFNAVCRPHPDVDVAEIIKGLVEFRNMYRGKIWLEVMLVKDVNDSREDLDALSSAIQCIQPDSIQLNTVVRPPAEVSALPLSEAHLKEIQAFLGDKAEIIVSFSKKTDRVRHIQELDILEYLKRRPGTADDISLSLEAGVHEVESLLEELKQKGVVKLRELLGKQFWEYVGN